MANSISSRRQQDAGVQQLLRDAASLHQQGRLDEAANRYNVILRHDPRQFDALHRLGVLRAQQDKLTEAQSLLRRAVERNPASAAAYNNLGNVFNLLKRHDAAIAPLEQALAINPDYATAHNNLGNALAGVGRDVEAATCFERALALKPDYAEAANNLASLHLQNGRAADARRLFETALRAEPENPAYYVRLFQCYTVEPSDPHLAALEKLADRIEVLSGDGGAQLHFGLAKAYGDIDQKERGFRHLLAGAALKRRQVVYDEMGREQRFELIRMTFTDEFICERAGCGNPSEVPVFIVGMMRSGSTLVEQIMASHPGVVALGEQPYLNEAYALLQRKASLRGPFPDAARALSRAQLRELGDHYSALLERAAQGSAAARITDKMLGNFTAVGLIHLALPNARIIHTMRDPIDTCLSCFSTPFTDDQPYAFDLRELGRYYRAYERLMAHWRAVLPPGVMLEVDYEDVVADLETAARRIVAHCGLEWDDSCLSFYKTERPIRTASATQVRRPLYTSSVGRWRPDAATLRPLLEGLGLNIG